MNEAEGKESRRQAPKTTDERYWLLREELSLTKQSVGRLEHEVKELVAEVRGLRQDMTKSENQLTTIRYIAGIAVGIIVAILVGWIRSLIGI